MQWVQFILHKETPPEGREMDLPGVPGISKVLPRGVLGVTLLRTHPKAGAVSHCLPL